MSQVLGSILSPLLKSLAKEIQPLGHIPSGNVQRCYKEQQKNIESSKWVWLNIIFFMVWIFSELD